MEANEIRAGVTGCSFKGGGGALGVFNRKRKREGGKKGLYFFLHISRLLGVTPTKSRRKKATGLARKSKEEGEGHSPGFKLKNKGRYRNGAPPRAGKEKAEKGNHDSGDGLYMFRGK